MKTGHQAYKTYVQLNNKKSSAHMFKMLFFVLVMPIKNIYQ